MTRARFHLLMTDPKASMTGAERLEWHFCIDWDCLLIHKNGPEFESCTCVHGAMIRAASTTGATTSRSYETH
jgi:hypothetical protein